MEDFRAEMEQVTVTIEPTADLDGKENGLILGGAEMTKVSISDLTTSSY